MDNAFNKKLAEKARKRRAMYYRLHINKGLSAAELGRRYGVSRQRMSLMLSKAAKDV